ncbi:hypothetical protein BEP19_00420 [Ammoniphilus oxalaticus]|uniref:DUF4467 domain-containing protein n=1 Tax=Ammoniphilus oxalaticus TaxID=66863 RepID=A0A419SRC8_9BACL|nr:hypothetical protein [Ammoniphilus oxalaticus]RKD27072.1 hypothetical protein BEP19_00420 [Ammoniphilus oxalaticus]
MKNIFIFSLLTLLLMGCSSSESVQVIEHIEVFTMDYLGDTPNSEGLMEIEGYRKVNSILRYETSSRSGKTTKLYEVADYYNNDGTYINSSIKYDVFRDSTNYSDTKEEMEFEPVTTLAADQPPESPGPGKELSEDEKNLIKEHVFKLYRYVRVVCPLIV